AGGPPFTFLPNPTLKAETGKNKEIGINLKYDNIFTANDSFRGKINVYRNDVDNFINLVLVSPADPACPIGNAFCEQYQNIPHARLQGAEFETMYDTGKWFAGLAGSHVRGRDTDANTPLSSVPPDFLTTTIGFRYSERVTVAARWQAVAAKKASEIPSDSIF